VRMLFHVRRADEGVATSADRRHFHLIRHQRWARILSDASVFECLPICLLHCKCSRSCLLACFTNVYENNVCDRTGGLQDGKLQTVHPERLRKTRKPSAKIADSWTEFEPVKA
jgi:hypothetical protein